MRRPFSNGRYSNSIIYRNAENDQLRPDLFDKRSLAQSGDIIAEALRHPVTITQRNKARLILLNIEDYMRLKANAATRTAGTIDTMPDALVREMETAIDAYAKGDE